MTRFLIAVSGWLWRDTQPGERNQFPWTKTHAEAHDFGTRDKAQATVDYWNKLHYRRTVTLKDGTVMPEVSGISGVNCKGGEIIEWSGSDAAAGQGHCR